MKSNIFRKLTFGISALGLVFALGMSTGCGVHYYSPDKPASAFDAEYNACQERVRKDVSRSPEGNTIVEEASLIQNCMKQKGWQYRRTFIGISVGEGE